MSATANRKIIISVSQKFENRNLKTPLNIPLLVSPIIHRFPLSNPSSSHLVKLNELQVPVISQRPPTQSLSLLQTLVALHSHTPSKMSLQPLLLISSANAELLRTVIDFTSPAFKLMIVLSNCMPVLSTFTSMEVPVGGVEKLATPLLAVNS